jgi:hypothetical protein
VLARLTNADRTAVAHGAYGQAALIANDLLVRERSKNPDNAPALEKAVYEDTAKALKVAHATIYDPQQGRNVMSPDLKSAIMFLQRSANISPSGTLDSKTLQQLSGTTIGAVLSNASIK